MRGSWSHKTPQRVSIAPAADRVVPRELRKAKRVGIAVASEKTKVTGGS